MAVSEPDKVEGFQRMDGIVVDAERSSVAQSDPPTRIIIKDCRQLQLLREMRLRSGLWLSVMDVKPEEGVRFRYEKKTPFIDFGFVLTGAMRNNLHSRATGQIEVNNRTGRGGIAFMPHSEGVVEIPAQQKMQILHVHVEPQVMHSLLEGELDVIPPELKPVVEGGETKGCFLPW